MSTKGPSGLIGISNPGLYGRWVTVDLADEIAAERDRYKAALEEIFDWAGQHLQLAVNDDYEPGQKDAADAFVSARALQGMLRLALATNQERQSDRAAARG
jgi:hypothetical protein